jgi:hypothetical protein
MTVKRSMHRAELLDHQPVPVRTDVSLHGLSPLTLEMLRRAIEQGLMPFDLQFVDDDFVILRLAQPRTGEAKHR